jgi:hypothetical protein
LEEYKNAGAQFNILSEAWAQKINNRGKTIPETLIRRWEMEQGQPFESR